MGLVVHGAGAWGWLSMGVVVRGTGFPWTKLSVGLVVHGLVVHGPSCPWAKLSMGQLVHGFGCPWDW
jgi:hypothetical protein